MLVLRVPYTPYRDGSALLVSGGQCTQENSPQDRQLLQTECEHKFSHSLVCPGCSRYGSGEGGTDGEATLHLPWLSWMIFFPWENETKQAVLLQIAATFLSSARVGFLYISSLHAPPQLGSLGKILVFLWILNL